MQKKVVVYDEALIGAERCVTFINSNKQTRNDFAKFLNAKADKNAYLQSPREYVKSQSI